MVDLDPADLLSFDLDLGPLTLRVHTAPLAPPGLGTGVGLWNGGEQLARFLASLPPAWARGMVALELGAGAAAAPARALAGRGGRALATDRGDALLGLTAMNVNADGHGRTGVAPLAWGDEAGLAATLGALGAPPTLVLAADVAYDASAWPALLATMAGVSRAGRVGAASPAAPVLLALPARPESAAFLPAAAASGWAHRTLRSVPPADPASVRTDIVHLWLEEEGDGTHTALVLVDFDWSCVEGNTDTLAAAALGPASEAALAAATAAGAGWTAAMGAALAVGHVATAEAGAAGVGMDGAVKAALLQAAGWGGDGGGGVGRARPATTPTPSPSSSSLVIVSDANDRLIAAALAAHGLAGAPSLVVTNRAGVGAGGQMTVSPFHGGGGSWGGPGPPPSSEGEAAGDGAGAGHRHHFPPSRAAHACPACPPNLCKGAVVEALLATARRPPARVLYLGDGANDACPCARLVSGGRPGDLVLARSHYPDGREAPLAVALRRLSAAGGGGGARVVEWRAAGEAGRAMSAWLAGEEGG